MHDVFKILQLKTQLLFCEAEVIQAQLHSVMLNDSVLITSYYCAVGDSVYMYVYTGMCVSSVN